MELLFEYGETPSELRRLPTGSKLQSPSFILPDDKTIFRERLNSLAARSKKQRRRWLHAEPLKPYGKAGAAHQQLLSTISPRELWRSLESINSFDVFSELRYTAERLEGIGGQTEKLLISPQSLRYMASSFLTRTLVRTSERTSGRSKRYADSARDRRRTGSHAQFRKSCRLTDCPNHNSTGPTNRTT